ncbi:thioredoxin [Phocaeicola paurosaccharolyticus]|jgi:thioredoxin 1|uniref:thioredoxin n=1 Tax=Phocaeicola paurosaccharolyticus TaxID=732242 RepID=UPI000469DF77|nr:thioredoxin [Phocaeicola paurosaccharolyticus]
MEKFNELIKSPIPVLVDFYATWCGPCKMMIPILEEVKKIKGDSVRIVKIDVDAQNQIANEYQIQAVPTLMIFKNGSLLWRQSGVMQAKELSNLLSQYE